MSDFDHLMSKVRQAKLVGDYLTMSTGEKVAVAIVLNRADWLKELDYTMAEAFDRVGPDWWPLLLKAQRQIDAEYSGDPESR
jgi:hypothetical protein